MAQLQSTSVTGSLIVTGGITGSFSGSIVAPGSNTQVLFNNSGIISANSGFVYSSGNVGIGTASPTNAKLEIVQSSTGEGLRVDGAGGGFALIVNGGSSYKTIMRNASIGDAYGGTTAPSNGLIVEGNVGIGTTSPETKLQVEETNGGGPGGMLYLKNSIEDSGTFTGIYFGTWGRKSGIFHQQGSYGGYGTGDLIFATNSALNGTVVSPSDAKMTITNPGNVGIGTSTFPASTYKFVVRQGTDRRLAIAEQSSDLSFEAYNDAQNANVPLRIYSSKLQLLAGNVGVGTTNPQNKFVVSDNGGIGLEFNPNYLGEAYIASYNRSSSSYSNLNFEASNIFFRTGASATLRGVIDSSGNFGIGTTNPGYKLDVNGSSRFIFRNNSNEIMDLLLSTEGAASKSKLSLLWYGNETAALKFVRGGNSTGGSIEFWTQQDGGSTTQKMTIMGDGNVGIGISSPSYLLDVAGTFGTSGNATFNGTNTYINSSNIVVGNDSTDVVGVAGNTMYFPGNGNIGIGTTSPGAKLHIDAGTLGTSTNNVLYNSLHYNSNGNNEFLEIKSVRTSAGSDWTHAGKRIQMRIDATYMGYMQFNGTGNQAGISFGTGTTTSDPGNVTERMRINSSGNVGIGTSSPTQRLSVDGGNIYHNYDNAATGYYFYLNHNSSHDGGMLLTRDNSTFDWQINNATSGNLWFYSYGLGAVALSMVKSNGYIGIGTASPQQPLHISKGDSSYTLYGPNATWGAYLITGAGPNAIGNGTCQVISTNGNLHLDSGTSQATYINAYSQTPTLINPDSGNVGIGSYSATEKLDVRGVVRISRSGVNDSGILAFGNYLSGAGYYDNGIFRGALNAPNTAGNLLHIASYEALVFTTSANPFGSQAIRMFINGSNGYVGIGTTTPSQPLHVTGRALVEGFQYGRAINYSSGDLNSLITAGFYDGSGMSNAPNSGWFYVTVETYSGDNNWIHQTATSFGSGNTANEVYTRVKASGTWGAWKELTSNTGTVTGTGVNQRVALWTGTSSQSSNANLTFDGSALGLTGTLQFPQNPVGTTYGNGVSSTPPYGLYQGAGDSDAIRLYAESAASNQVSMVFEVNDDLENAGNEWLWRNKKTYGDYAATTPMRLSGDGTLYITGNATFGSGASRPVTYDSAGGNFKITPSAGGWATGYFFNGSSGTFRGGFGGYGSSNGLNYYWIGDDWNIPTMIISPNQGNVGIGTTSPGSKLDVNGNIYANGDIRSQGAFRDYQGEALLETNTSAVTLLGSLGAGTPRTLAFLAGNAERMRITTAGDIAVGTTAALLNTAGRGNITINGSSEAILTLGAGGAWKSYLYTDGTNTIIGAVNNFIVSTNNGGTTALYASTSGNVGIGTTTPGAKLEVVGSFRATTKSFIIDHPTKEGKKLQYGVLEGPEHSVYVRGKLTGTRRIELPDYWHALVDENSITVNLTAIGRKQELWVEDITDTYITIGSEAGIINCFYTVFAERKDVEKLVTEFDKE